MLQRKFNAIMIIVLLLSTQLCESSNKMKSGEQLKKKLQKAGIRINKTNTKTNIDCSASSIMGVDGKCVNLNPSGLTNYMPSVFAPTWSALSNVISTASGASGPLACLGDYNGSAFDANDDLSTALCSTIPVVSNATFGLIGMDIPVMPCGNVDKSLTDMAFCFTLDKCGTLAVAFNGGFIQCSLFYAGTFSGVGILNVAAAAFGNSGAADSLGNFSIGISPGRQFSNDIRVAYRDGDNVHSGTVTTYGHVFVDLGLNFPTDFLKFGKKDLSSFFSLTADILFMIDFGDVDTVVNGIIDAMKNANTATGKALLTRILNEGSEMSLAVDGTLTLGLQDLTKGVLCDISTSLTANILITTGSGRSGLEAGIYFRIGSDVASDLVNSLLGLLNNFSDVLSQLGITIPSVPPVGIELGLFLTVSALGFQFTFFSVTFKCMVLFDSGDFSCQINAKIFTIIAEALNFVFREAAKFFDKSGKVLATKTQAAVKAATQLVTNTVKDSIGKVKDLTGKYLNLTSNDFAVFKNAAVENLKWLENGMRNETRRAAQVAKKIVNFAGKAAELAACTVKNLLNKKKRRKCKNKVEDKYRNDSRNQVDSCYSTENTYTSWTETVGNSTALGSHILTCAAGSALSFFRVERSETKVRYRYQCVKSTSISKTCTSKSTTLKYIGTFGANWLSEHNVQCGDSAVLTKLRLVYTTTSPEVYIQYKYTCCQSVMKSCDTVESTNEDSGDYSIANLERLLVTANEGRIISGFKLNLIGDSQWNYLIRACTPDAPLVTPRDTGCDSDGDGSIFYLDRHPVECNKGKAIQYFHYSRDTNDDSLFRYDYSCVDSDSISLDCYDTFTPHNDTASNPKESLQYLDRHNVSCNAGYLLSYFKLQRTENGKGNDIYYVYKCCKASLGTCSTWNTDKTDLGNKSTHYLDRQTVNAGANSGIQAFKFNRNGDDIWYSVTSCPLN